jgi:hypothetical protein
MEDSRPDIWTAQWAADDSDGFCRTDTWTAQWAARSKNSARARSTEIMDGRLGDAESSLDQFQVQ